MFLRKTSQDRDPLVVAMSGVRRGERVLQIGLDDPHTACLVAGKAGLSGHAALVTPDDATATKASTAVARAGASLDVHVAPFDQLPFSDASFDVAIINSAGGLLGALDSARPALLSELLRVVRPGGRVITVEAGSPTSLLSRFTTRPQPGAYETAGGASRALADAGFTPVRELADTDGFRFVEGFRR